MEQIFTQLTVWHWVAFGLVLLGIEMLTGTFDFLMIAIAAWAAAVFEWLAPDTLSGWQGQLVFFAVAAVIMVVFGRTFLAGLRGRVEEHPTLNKRMASLVGQRGQATVDFAAGNGRVKIGDTVWGAEAVEGETIRQGDAVVVEGARMNTAIVRRAG
ncbi:MAG: NfeD family protein [Hyphomonas sp.]|nr:NfeD family protein [Hyphomonas sp.]MCB9960728.1 NfeD family protein [Hyphomonas sp.]MCB9971923.1 NfeD family protein [Hyphomonas sp.]